MKRSVAVLRRLALAALLALVALSLVARPVERGPLEDTDYRLASLRTLEAALVALDDASPGGLLEAGGAKREIVPPLEWRVPMAGNRGVRFTRATGRRPESVWARAVALRQGERRAILVSADILVIHPLLAARVLERIRSRIPLEADELLLVAAHSHSGPGGYWDARLAGLSVGPYDERVLDFLVDELSAVALEAWSSTLPSRAAVGERPMPLTLKNRTRNGGPENPQLGLLRFESLDGSSVVELVNYSAHPTNLLRGNDLYSGDYPALMASMVDSPRRTLVFTPGTIGDMKAAFDGVPDPAKRARSIAEHLVERGLETMTPELIESPTLEAFEVEVAMPPLQARLFRSDLFGSWALRPWLAARLFPAHFDRTVVQVLRIGPVAILGAPADLSSSLALPLLERARRRGLTVFFVSMAEDWIGYLMRADEYLETDYKPVAQLHGPQAGALFTLVYERLIDALAARAAGSAGAAEQVQERIGAATSSQRLGSDAQASAAVVVQAPGATQ